MAERLLTILRKNAREEVRVYLADGGPTKVVLREFFETPEGDKFPGRYGIKLRLDLLDAVVTAIHRELAQASLSLEAAE